MKRNLQSHIILLLSVLLTTMLFLYQIKEATADTIWIDDFESYPVSTFPSPPWTGSGNIEAFIDDTISVSHSKSFKFFGVLGSCWGALAHRQITIPPPFIIEFHLYNGPEMLSGCHPSYGGISLNTGPSWTFPERHIIHFDKDNWIKIKTGDDYIDLGSYLSETWYKVKIKYEIVNAGSVCLSYWINDVFTGSYNSPSFSHESDLTYIAIVVGEGSAWFDDVKISSAPTPDLFPDDTEAPTGAVHAYPNRIWPPNNQMATVTLDAAIPANHATNLFLPYIEII